jgi:hypothetical protein
MAANKFLVREGNSGSKRVKNDVHHVEEIAKPNVSSPTPRPNTSAQALYSLDLTHARHFIVRFSQFFGIIQ